MCLVKTPDVEPAPVLETPRSEATRRRGEQEQALRRRLAGVQADTMTGPLGIPASSTLGAG